jgi:catechol 2,3-dioxygenase
MAMNTWRSKGAGKRQLALGLGKVEIVLDSQDQVLETKDRLDFYKLDTSLDSNIAIVEDPWGNIISLQSKTSLPS